MTKNPANVAQGVDDSENDPLAQEFEALIERIGVRVGATAIEAPSKAMLGSLESQIHELSAFGKSLEQAGRGLKKAAEVNAEAAQSFRRDAEQLEASFKASVKAVVELRAEFARLGKEVGRQVDVLGRSIDVMEGRLDEAIANMLESHVAADEKAIEDRAILLKRVGLIAALHVSITLIVLLIVSASS